MSPTSLTESPFRLDETAVLWVEETLARMSEDEKIRQLFCLITYDDDEQALTRLAREVKPGGVMCRPMPLDACRRAARIMQDNSDVPLLLSANLESGGAQAVTEGTALGRPMQIAALPRERTAFAERLGRVSAREGMAAGLNWSFSPVADIDFNWRNPITNTRTFGSDPDTVAELTAACVRGIESEGMAACAKHFPGDGRDERDQHIAPSVNDLDVEGWDRTYGQVWRRAIREGVRSIMVGHILFPAWERREDPGAGREDLLPASVSRAVVTGLLREHLGFGGLIVTDSSTMAGLACFLPRERLVPMTIAAGCDMFLFTKDYTEDLSFMKSGLEAGIITRERLDQAVTRILALKASLGLHEKQRAGTLIPPEKAAHAVVGCREHRQWAGTVAAEAITLVREETGVLPLTPEKYPRLLFVPLDDRQEGASVMPTDTRQNERLRCALEEAGFRVTVFRPAPGFEGMMTPVREVTDSFDAIIYAASLATRSNRTTVRIAWAPPMGADVPVYTHTLATVFVSLDNPYHLIDVPQVRTYINCYAGTDDVIRGLVDRLLGRAAFSGVSPVDVEVGGKFGF
ncbi:MAG: glycoside hydrolase family 3 protein [Clostridia bacterium]|nr:glycoside hydrolase family 3 protein [Clostridia bacterium]